MASTCSSPRRADPAGTVRQWSGLGSPLCPTFSAPAGAPPAVLLPPTHPQVLASRPDPRSPLLFPREPHLSPCLSLAPAHPMTGMTIVPACLGQPPSQVPLCWASSFQEGLFPLRSVPVWQAGLRTHMWVLTITPAEGRLAFTLGASHPEPHSPLRGRVSWPGVTPGPGSPHRVLPPGAAAWGQGIVPPPAGTHRTSFPLNPPKKHGLSCLRGRLWVQAQPGQCRAFSVRPRGGCDGSLVPTDG